MKEWIGMLICSIVTALIGWKVLGMLVLGARLFSLPYYFKEDKLDELKRHK